MRTLQISQPIAPPLCLQPLSPDATPDAGAWVLSIKKKRYALGGDLVSRAATLSVDALRGGGLVLLGLHEVDGDLFAPAGFTEAWARGYRAVLDMILEQHRARTEAAHEERAARFASGERSTLEESRELLREVAQLAQAGSIRGGFDFVAADLQSLGGVRDALWEATAKLRVPAFRETLVKRGLDEARIRRLPVLCDALLQEQAEELVAQGRQAGAGDELLAWKAMALGDLTMLSTTARARLPQERWEPYQIGRLLGLSRPAERREDRPAPEPPVTPPPAPVDPAPTPAGPAAFTTVAAPPQLLPGTVLHTAPGVDGNAWVLLVGPDGAPRWTPTAAPAPTARATAPLDARAPAAPIAAAPIAAPSSKASPAPARSRGRRSRR